MYLVFFFLLSSFGFTQEPQGPRGTLVEKGTRKPLADVSVFILPEKLKAVTNQQGEFVFESAPLEQACTLIVNSTGYLKYEESLPCGKISEKKIYLEKKFYTSFETTVTGKYNKRDDQAQSLTQEEFLKAPGSFGGDPVRAAQNLPGIAQNGASAQIIVQGASPDDTAYLINGHRVPLVFHFGGLSSVITPEAVDRVELLPSGYGPEYSRAIGGIIGLTTKDPKRDRVHGIAFIDLLNSGGLIEGPVDEKSSFLLAGRYSYIGQALKVVAAQNDNFELTAAPTYYDFTGIYERRMDEKNRLKTTFIASRDELKLILSKAADNDPLLRGKFTNRTEFFRLIPQISTQLSETTRMDHSLGLGRDSILVDIGGRYLDVNSNVLSHRSELLKEWSGKSKTFVGLDNQLNQSDFRINLPNSYEIGGVGTPFSVGEARKFDDTETLVQLGAYVRQELKPSADSRWTFLPNVRFDHFSVNDDSVVQPRFQLRYQQNPSLLYRASWGKYVQSPRPQEISDKYGNRNLRSPSAYHYTVGFTKDFRSGGSEGLELTNNYFYKELEDVVNPDLERNYVNNGSGTIIGGEVQAKYRKAEWTSQLVYTHLKSRLHTPGFGTRPSENDQTHNLNLIGAYGTERWRYSARFRFVTGNPYTPVAGATYDSDNDVYIPTRGRIYSQRFDPFNQLDIRVDRNFVYEKWILTAYLDIQNVLNQANAQNVEYSYDYREKKKVRGLPILPTIGLKGEF